MRPLFPSRVGLALLAMGVISMPATAGNEPEPALRLVQATRPLVIAHRGASAAAPENTLPAFTLGLAAGADLVELDYRHSADGVPMVMHDPTLDRTTDAVNRWGGRNLLLRDHTAAQLQSLDAGAWFDPRFAGTPPPRLDAALDLICRDGVALIEHKAGEAGACMRLLRDRRLVNHVVVQSFDWDYLRDCHALVPEQVLGALGPQERADGRPLTRDERELTAAHLDAMGALGARVVVWNRDLSATAVAAAHARGLRVWVYTVDDPAVALALLSLGVDGIITNQPALLRQKLPNQPPP